MKSWIHIFGSLVFLISINISIFFTVPRIGSEGILLWMFLVPGFIIANSFLIVTIIIFTISIMNRQKNKINTQFVVNEFSTDQKNE